VLLLVSIIKLVCEIALLALAGRWLLSLLAGQKKESNFFYQALVVLTKPFVSAARFITPKAIIDRHVPLVAFLLLSIIWLVSVIEKVRICTTIGMELCK
jgi:YGGT family